MSEQEHHPIEPMASLPFDPKWRYRPYDIPNFVLAPGATRDVCDLKRHGYVVWGGITHSNPLLSCTIKLETGTEEYSTSFTCNDLMVANLIAPMSAGWWVSRYDLLNNVFTVMFTPAAWWPFYRRLNISLTNNTVMPITVLRVSVLCIEFLDDIK